jgi:signal-transduction protein with cAMP-binding, CBS, and nucleotidyltransferase domain
MHEVRFRKDEVIFSEGDTGEHCYKILSGKVEIVVKVPGVMRRGQKEKIATCGPGEFIGEMSLIVGGPRSATAVSAEPTVCRAYSADEILGLLQGDPQEALAYMQDGCGSGIRGSHVRLRSSGGVRPCPAHDLHSGNERRPGLRGIARPDPA